MQAASKEKVVKIAEPSMAAAIIPASCPKPTSDRTPSSAAMICTRTIWQSEAVANVADRLATEETERALVSALRYFREYGAIVDGVFSASEQRGASKAKRKCLVERRVLTPSSGWMDRGVF